ncbi:hypothetical protein FA13DRAFT_1734164 [Coprinellus micaceus]|uniref:Uncharacterized protein n=1 Tax=Coprinellus micaceus TaxID=71717 RepID=A0A4Y7T8C7_COPMI|nr:hypothetical protein FA13DRAFT_1734164 [Coprinellus micaceus]
MCRICTRNQRLTRVFGAISASRLLLNLRRAASLHGSQNQSLSDLQLAQNPTVRTASEIMQSASEDESGVGGGQRPIISGSTIEEPEKLHHYS